MARTGPRGGLSIERLLLVLGVLTLAVTLLKSLVPGFTNPHTGWLVLAMASTLAGNLTITGFVTNIIVVERARPEAEIGFSDYFKVGPPITLVTLGLGSFWLW